VLADEATTTPKARSGIVEAIRVLRVACTGAIKARTQTANQLRDLLVTAPRSCTPSCTLCRPPSESSAR
jgi:transposase